MAGGLLVVSARFWKWHLLAAVGESPSLLAMAEEKALAGPADSGRFQAWRSQRCKQSTGM